MSSDFDDRLRDARDALPVPDEPSTERARRRVLAGGLRKRRRGRVLVLAVSMLVCAVAIAVSAGSLSAPSVTAARGPATLGFVPEPGWFALQSPPPAVEGQQTVAVAANVPFAADDVDDGLVEPSGLPYSTLLRLPPDGIVIVATMTPETIPHVAPVPANPYYPRIELPIRLDDALPWVQWGAQVRPDEPLAQYQLRGQIAHLNLDLTVYFGTPRPTAELRAAAQRQLSSLVLRKQRAPTTAASAAAARRATVAVIDRTYSCRTVLLGGLYQIETRAHAGQRGPQWLKLPYAVVATGGVARTPFVDAPPDSSIAWVTAGEPSPTTTVDEEYLSFTARVGGTVGVNHTLCTPSRDRVPLASNDLRGGGVGPRTVEFECAAPRTVLVRMRATVQGGTALRDRARLFRATSSPTSHAELAVRTPKGRLLVYAKVFASGQAQLFTRKGCKPE